MNSIIQRILREWKKEAKATRVIQFKYTNKTIYDEETASSHTEKKLKIYTSQPGFLIGYHGSLFYKYAAELIKENIVSTPGDISFEETAWNWV